jgi:hypothetical protein
MSLIEKAKKVPDTSYKHNYELTDEVIELLVAYSNNEVTASAQGSSQRIQAMIREAMKQGKVKLITTK